MIGGSVNFPDAVPVLSGSSLHLREITEADIPAWFQRATDAEAADLAGDPIPDSIDLGVEWLQRQRDHFRDKTALRWAIVPTGSAVSVGTVGLALKPGEGPKAELGIVIARLSWGKGIGTAATKLVIGYAFAELGIDEVRASVLRRNPASIRLLEKAGFRFLSELAPTEAEPEALLLYRCSKDAPAPSE